VIPGNSEIKWNDIDDNFVKSTKTPEEVKLLSRVSLLCVSGEVLE